MYILQYPLNNNKKKKNTPKMSAQNSLSKDRKGIYLQGLNM